MEELQRSISQLFDFCMNMARELERKCDMLGRQLEELMTPVELTEHDNFMHQNASPDYLSHFYEELFEEKENLKVIIKQLKCIKVLLEEFQQMGRLYGDVNLLYGVEDTARYKKRKM